MPPQSPLVVPPAAELAIQAVRQWKQTDARFAAALEANVPPPQALSAYGLRLCRAQNPAQAARVFHAALAFCPDDPILWNNLAVALDRTSAFAQAIACLQQSLSLLHSQHDTWLLLGGIQKKIG